jgi:hypothetical protein
MPQQPIIAIRVALSGRVGKTLNYAGNNLERSAQKIES